MNWTACIALGIAILFLSGCVGDAGIKYGCADGTTNSKGCDSDVYVTWEKEGNDYWIGHCNFGNVTKDVRLMRTVQGKDGPVDIYWSESFAPNAYETKCPREKMYVANIQDIKIISIED